MQLLITGSHGKKTHHLSAMDIILLSQTSHIKNYHVVTYCLLCK